MKKKINYKKMYGVYNVERLAYAPPTRILRYNTAKYPSRTGFFVNLDHYSVKDKKVLEVTYKGQLYTIPRRVASENLIELSFIPNCPTMVPFELWTVSEIPEHKIAVEWEIDPVNNIARRKEWVPEPEQLGLL